MATLKDDIVKKDLETFKKKCTNCGRCTDLCQTFIQTGQKPLDLLKAPFSKDAYIHCNQCGRCLERCPLNLDYGSLLLSLKTRGYENKAFLSPVSKLRLNSLYYRRTLKDYNNHSEILRALSGAKDNSITLVFPGCSATQKKHKGLSTFIEDLASSHSLNVYKDCCQVPRKMIGDDPTYQGHQDKIAAVFNHPAVKKVLLFCPNCWRSFNLNPNIPKEKLVYFTHYLKGNDFNISEEKLKGKIRLHHPCPIKSPVIKSEAEALFEATKIISSHQCCGSGGMSKVLSPAAFKSYQNVLDTFYTEPIIVTYCFECQAALKRPQRKTYHLLDFYKNKP